MTADWCNGWQTRPLIGARLVVAFAHFVACKAIAGAIPTVPEHHPPVILQSPPQLPFQHPFQKAKGGSIEEVQSGVTPNMGAATPTWGWHGR